MSWAPTPGAIPPLEGTYWVVPGSLLAGPYPGHPESSVAQQRLGALTGAGIGHFTNLMFADEVGHDGRFFAPYDHLVPSMVRIPIVDVSIPTPETMVEILDHIDAHLDEGVYVHCWGGVGRTGTTVGCWLLRHGLVTPDDVLATIEQLRTMDTLRGHRQSPETFTQRRFVTDWEFGK